MISFSLSQALSYPTKPSTTPAKALTSTYNAREEIKKMLAEHKDDKAGKSLQKLTTEISVYCLNLLNLAEPNYVSQALDGLSDTNRNLLLNYWKESNSLAHHLLYLYYQPCSEWPEAWINKIPQTLDLTIEDAKYLIPALKVKYSCYLEHKDEKLLTECDHLMHDTQHPLWHLNLSGNQTNHFKGMRYVAANIPGANLSNASLGDTVFDYANLSYSSLENTYTQSARMFQIQKLNCNMNGMFSETETHAFTDGELKKYFDTHATAQHFEPLHTYFRNYAYFCGLFKCQAPRDEYLAAIYLLRNLNNEKQPYQNKVSTAFMKIVTDIKANIKPKATAPTVKK